MMHLKTLFAAGIIVSGSLALPGHAEATSCGDTYVNDIGLCYNQREACFNDPNYSFWTGTCNLQYLGCTTGAELVYADCILPLIVG